MTSDKPSTPSHDHDHADVEKVEEVPLPQALDDKHAFSKPEKWTIVVIIAFAGLFRQV